ncbi:GlxA family transcriptional regulator [Methylomonas methanica]|uniref:AraC family transcriptional regulator n=1 Tax=Methylomonas methanica TaxID=421 RepID=A0A177LUQ4_METMH|nr:helix-turn-helix domain-containing protein [Methylomonas methanica]OAH96278.1 AraC family transcriptional regulator [Methylomonas methanica]OAI10259.1 AraC family transcriptional regulator [Methylomonas methanica]
MHKIAVLALNSLVSFDLAIPCMIFGLVKRTEDKDAYSVYICSETKVVNAGVVDLSVRWGLDQLETADTVIIPGIADLTLPISDTVIAALRVAAERGARMVSICTGAFVLAEAGLLDGLRVTTHWREAGELARRFPKLTVDPNVLYIDNGQILTSAGLTAGIDLCLHIVRLDHGSRVAADAARLAVMPLERDGGQAQFIVHETPSSATTLQPLLAWLENNLNQPLTLDDLARQSAMSKRTLSRRFMEQVGTTPLQWLLTSRIRRAQQILETTQLSVEHIATATGFGSATAFRERFNRLVGISPQAYRRAFNGSDQSTFHKDV